MTVLGAVSLPQLPPERLLAVARAADDAGLEELWLWEDCFWGGGIASAAAVLGATRRLAVGVGVLPVPLRNAALSAMEVAALERMFPGRVRPGFGHGVQSWMAQVGAKPASPLTLLREHAAAITALLAGEEVTTEGRYVRLDRVRLDQAPPVAPVLHLGGEGPKTLRLTGEVGGGTVLTGGTGPDGVRRARALVEEGRRVAGRDDPVEITVYVLTAIGPDAAPRLEQAYRDWGIEPSEKAGLAGDAAAVAAGLAPWVEAGADRVVLQPTGDDPDPEEFVRAVAQDVRPLVP